MHKVVKSTTYRKKYPPLIYPSTKFVQVLEVTLRLHSLGVQKKRPPPFLIFIANLEWIEIILKLIWNDSI